MKVMLWAVPDVTFKKSPFPLSSSSLTPPSELTQLINTPAVAIRNASIFLPKFSLTCISTGVQLLRS